jgi:hypothetical protein
MKQSKIVTGEKYARVRSKHDLNPCPVIVLAKFLDWGYTKRGVKICPVGDMSRVTIINSIYLPCLWSSWLKQKRRKEIFEEKRIERREKAEVAARRLKQAFKNRGLDARVSVGFRSGIDIRVSESAAIELAKIIGRKHNGT